MKKFDLFVGVLSGAENVKIITNLSVNRLTQTIRFTLNGNRCYIEYDEDTNEYFFTEHLPLSGPRYIDDIDYDTLVKKLY